MELTLEKFNALLGSQFLVDTAAGKLPLELYEVSELASANRPAQFRTPLSLIFKGSSQWLLQQDNYLFEHAAMGQGCWMLVPTSPPLHFMEESSLQKENANFYQVIFA